VPIPYHPPPANPGHIPIAIEI